MTTWGDMMSLLLCFFILLYSFSSLDNQRFREIMVAFKNMAGFLDGGTNLIPEGYNSEELSPFADSSQIQLQSLEALAAVIQNLLEEEGFVDQVELSLEDRGLVMRFKDVVLFDIGSDALKEAPKEMLKKLSVILEKVPLPIRIEGHTDNVPINNARFPSNWELSVARAVKVVRFLIEEGSLDSERLSALGYGEYRPIESNATPEGRNRNRRVDIIVLHPSLAGSEPGAEWLEELSRTYPVK